MGSTLPLAVEESIMTFVPEVESLEWFARKYRVFADRNVGSSFEFSFRAASSLAEAEVESIRSEYAEGRPVTDEERRRVIRDILAYRLLPNSVIDYLNSYLEVIDDELVIG